MKRTTFFKSLLVAAGLFVGANAWADATSIYERGTTNAWAATDISENEWTGSDGTLEVTTAAPVGLKYTSPNNGGGMYTKAITTKDNSKITVNATWYVGGSTGRAGNHNILQLGSLQFRAYGQDQYGGLYDVSGTEIAKFGGKDDVRTSGAWIIQLVIDKSSGDVSYSVDLPSSEDVSGETTLASVSFTNIGIGFTRGGRTNTSNSTLEKIEVLEEEQVVKTANYTIKYLLGETAIKEESERKGVVGSSITLTDADKASVYVDGTKYVYSSDDSEGKTIEEGAVVNVYFREAEKYAYTLNAVVGENVLKELASGEQFEGEKATVYFNKAIFVDGKWYSTTNACNYTFTDAATATISFAEDANITYFYEVEDINKSTNWAATGSYPDRYSNGKAGRLTKGAYAYTDALEGGVYNLTLWGRNQAGSSEAAIGVYVRDQENNENKCENQFENWAIGAQGVKTIEVTIPVGSCIVIKNENADYNSNLEMDYIILEKTGEAPAVTKTLAVTSIGYATFCSPYALDFSNATSIEAYTAKVDEDGKITFTNVKTVAAGEGVLLKSKDGKEAEEEIPVIASAEANANNDFVGIPETVQLAQTAYGATNYILSIVDNKLGFYMVNTNGSWCKGGTAYLKVSSAKARAFYSLDNDTTTAISDELVETESDAAVFNLNGQRVTAPQKGLYIVNGKKVVVK